MKICSRSVLDTTIPGITFDENGVSHYCKIYDEMEKLFPLDETGSADLKTLVEKIKKSGKGKKYDCIIGVSGGTDSTYTMLKVHELGLRPLAIHVDNGWNSEIAVKNIKKACSILGIELYTRVLNWEEFKQLQISFLRASVPDAEIPTDVAIHSTLVRMAAEEGIKYVLNGHSFRTEFIMPKGWGYMDGRYIKSVFKKFTSRKLQHYPNFEMQDVLYFNFIKGVNVVPFLNYFNYSKEAARTELETKLDWEYYGGHHHENIFTKFYISHLLPVKFNIDKRKTVLSARILSGQITRDEALKILENEKHHVDRQTVEYVAKKLDLEIDEFEKILNLPRKTFHDYPTYYPLIRKMKPLIFLACKFGFLPMIIYYKFLDD